MEDMGIGDATTVVVYDSSGSLWASRFWWVLNYYGHTKTKVLDGGWKKWFDEGRPLSIDQPTQKQVTFTPKTTDSLICTIEDGLRRIGSEETVFLDVRSDGEWDGTNDRGNERSGRVPGAIHIEWLNFVEDDSHKTFKSPDLLRKLLLEKGITPEKEIVTY
jgi:thiosulfate/3-mercaptopyruvate sulfurtransferase